MKKQLIQIFGPWVLIILITSCLPTAKESSCSDGEAFDAQERKCVPIEGVNPSTVFISSHSPSNSYSLFTTSAPILHEITISDSYNQGYTIDWRLQHSNGGTINPSISVGSGLTYSFNPATLYGVGNYVLEAILRNAANTVQIDVQAWNITVTDLAYPELVSPSPATTAYTYASNLTTANHDIQISNPDSRSGSFNYYIDGVLDAPNSGTFNAATTNFPITINPSTLGEGIHTLEIQLTDGVSTVFDTYVWTINVVAPDLPQMVSTAPSYFNSISVIDSETFAAGGYRDSSNNALAQICVTVDNFDKDGDLASDIDIAFEINGVQQGAVGTFAANQYCHTTFNTQTLTNPDVSEGKTLSAKILRQGTTDIIEVVQWNINVRPRNMRPEIQIDSTNTSPLLACTAGSNISYTACSMIQSVDVDNNNDYTNAADDADNSRVLAVEIITNSDPDIVTPDQYEVVYQIRKTTDALFQDVDAVANSYTRADCSFTAANTQVGSGVGDQSLTLPKLQCNLPIDAFSSASGHIAPGDYVVQAYVRDTGSVWDATPKESNRVSWAISVSEYQTSPMSISIAAQAAGAPGANESWIENSDAACSTTGTVVNAATSIAENDYMIVHTFVRDIERDDFDISIKMENGLLGGYSTVASLQTISRTDDNEYYEVTSCFRVPEWAVSGVASNTVDVRVSVTDRPDNIGLAQSPASPTDFVALVTNDNPAPQFADNSAVDLSTHRVFAGVPFSITAASYSDASVADGNVVTYQWQVSTNGGGVWTDIPNANSTDQTSANLIWTPNLDIAVTQVSLRLCLGDDGLGNPSDCSNALSTKEYQNIQVSATSLQAASFTAATSTNAEDINNVATWYDTTNGHLYTAYSINEVIHVTKHSADSNGTLSLTHAINFETEDTTVVATVSQNAQQISVTGVDGQSLLVAYVSADSTSSNPFVKVRRIDISNGDLAFAYGGFFNGELDTDDRISNISYAAGPSLSLSAPGDGDMTITVNSVNNGDQFDISTSTGNVSVIVGSNPGDVCEFTACATTATLAANIASFINNHSNAEISQELTAEHTTGSSVVTIRGPGVADYYDETTDITSIVGNIEIDPTNTSWVIPHVDVTNTFTLSVLRGLNPLANLSGTVVSSLPISGSSQFIKEISAEFNSSNEYIAAVVNTNNNVDIYRMDGAYSVQSSITDAYTLASYQIEGIDLKVGLNDYVYLASKSTISASSTENLSMLIADPTLANYISNVDFTVIDDRVQNVSSIKVAPSPSVQGEATLIIKTNGNHANAHNIYMASTSHDTVSWVTPITFDVSVDTSYSSPALNALTTTTDSAFAVTPIFSLTRGFQNEASVAADSVKPFVFMSYMQDNGLNREIQSTMLNTTVESILTNSTAVTGSYPGLLKN